MTDEVLTLLRTLLTEQRALRAEVRALRGRVRPEPDAALARLPQAIARAIGSQLFTCSDLKEHAALPGQEELRAALRAVVGDAMSTRRLGKKLKSVEGCVIDGLSVHHVEAKNDGHGLTWMVKEVSAV